MVDRYFNNGIKNYFANSPNQTISLLPSSSLEHSSSRTSFEASQKPIPAYSTTRSTLSTRISPSNHIPNAPPLSTTTTLQANTVDSLSGGALAGIVISTVAAIVIFFFSFFFCRRRLRQKQHELVDEKSSSRIQNMNRAVAGTTVLGGATLPSPFTGEQQQHPPGISSVYTYPPVNNNKNSSNLNRTSMIASASASAMTNTNQGRTSATASMLLYDEFLQTATPLNTYTIISTYIQTLDDELYVEQGDTVQTYCEYDDGWCLGINLTRGGTRGVFPLHCTKKI